MKKLEASLAPIKFNTDEDWKSKLVQQDVFPAVQLLPLKDLTEIPCKDRVSQAIISNGRLIHVASDHYTLLKNEDFFLEVERKLIEADIKYITRSINRDNSAFAVDYILDDERYHMDVKGKGDRILPMMRFINTYDGSSMASGSFGVYRMVCSNGLHVAERKVGFKLRHNKNNIANAVLPSLDEVVKNFIENEWYSLHKKFEVLAERPLKDMEGFVEYMVDATKLFTFETSDGELTRSSIGVMEIIEREADMLGTKPNLWLGYNAFNEYLHGTARNLANQIKLDGQLFELVEAYGN
jgi:hypothetical protein